MSRPCKRRRICALPRCGRFAPVADGMLDTQPIIMTLDEYETIRLIDLEELSQAECALQMNVARTTVQAIYTAARQKLAQCLVNQQELLIQGGDYELCKGGYHSCPKHRSSSCHHECHKDEGGFKMRIAVTYENGSVFQHFGHTEQMKVYDVADGKVTASAVVSTNGNGHGALAGFLTSIHVDMLICGGIGLGAQQALAQAGIELYAGITGLADDAVAAYLAGTLPHNTAANCNHHDHDHHEHGHDCGHHCGEHSCHH